MSIDIRELLRLMVERGASDMHLKVPSLPVMRIDGVLEPVAGLSAMTPESIQAVLEAITTTAQHEAFFRDLELDMAYSIPGLARFRVNAFFQRSSIALAFRLVHLQVLSLDALGLPDVCRSMVLRPRGLVLVTGPSGSGKSTTLAAMIDYLNECEMRHIITIEDPIEFLHRDKRSVIAQRELGSDTRSFANALRHILRQDPDVIMLGEMRDLETTAIAITAAETGHLVLGTMHTMGAAQTIDRIIDLFPSSQQAQVRAQLALVLEGVLSQQLLPRVGGGRVAAVEVMVTTPAIRNLLRDGKAHQVANMIQMGATLGMQTLDQALAKLVAQGTVALDEALTRAADPEELRRLLRSY